MLGLTPFETLMAGWAVIAVLIRASEWVFRRNVDAGEFVKRSDWDLARAKDIEAARHFTRGEISLYVTQKHYDRDWKETNRRLEHLEARPI